MERSSYKTDLTNDECPIIDELLSSESGRGRPRKFAAALRSSCENVERTTAMRLMRDQQ